MALKIDMLAPGGTVTYEIGVDSVQNIVVHYYFANVVDVIIYYTDNSKIRYYQVPCVLYTPAP
jgi:hypothetical protein